MAVYLDHDQFNTPGKDYAPFHAEVKKLANGWFSYFNDSWIINNAQLSSKEIAEKLFPYMTKSDRLLVVKLTKDYFGWLPQEAWKWLGDREF
jgi:hypothetical protein